MSAVVTYQNVADVVSVLVDGLQDSRRDDIAAIRGPLEVIGHELKRMNDFEQQKLQAQQQPWLNARRV